MLLKESKIRVLENFYALDYVFFGKSVNKVDTCCPLVREEYLSIKGALLSVFVEMLKLVEHKPAAISEQVDSNALLKNAKHYAKLARESSQRVVMTKKARANIKESLKEILAENPNADIAGLVEEQIRQKAFRLAADNLMLARVSLESQFNKLNDWEGRIIEDSYKILRDNLVEAAYQILHDDVDVLEEDDNTKWNQAIKEDSKQILDSGVSLKEEFTDREKTFLFGGIQRLFGQCAAKCGRITIFSKANACKDNCIAKRDAAIKAARAKAKAAKAQAAGKTAKAAKFTQKAKDIQGYAK